MKHRLPELPYDYAALEPHIDAQTMELHHGKHHAGYVANLNAALEALPELRDQPATWLLRNLAQVPAAARETVRNNAGGHVNHSMFWRAMSAAGGGAPAGPLADALRRDFGSVDKFRAEFDAAGAKLFGSGWVWLAKTRGDGGELVVLTTAGHDNPLMQDMIPILVDDVWEHAYYLKHQNRRPAYLEGWWSVVNWREAERLFAAGDAATDTSRADAGGTLLAV
ncbi:MAG: superoxide dismutase [Burkholderiales bacterium]